MLRRLWISRETEITLLEGCLELQMNLKVRRKMTIPQSERIIEKRI